MTKIYSVKEIFSIDLRSLALFRVLMGALAAADGLNRLSIAEAHYSDSGVLPRAAYLADFATQYEFSLTLLFGDWRFQAALMLLQSLCALCFMVGYRGRLSAFLTWILLLSFHIRLPINAHGGDDVLRLMFFWSIFLPVSAKYSVDAILNSGREPVPVSVSGFAPAAILLQLASVYSFSFIQKCHPVWYSEFSAIYYALNVDHLVTAQGRWLLRFPTFLKLATLGTMILEGTGPLLVFSPVFLSRLRMIVPPAFILFHFGLFLGMYLGIFPWVCAISWLLFLPGEFWARFEPKLDIYFSRFHGLVPKIEALFRKRPLASKVSWFSQGLAAVFLLLVLWWNLTTVHAAREMPKPLGHMLFGLYLDSKWNLFAPYPLRDDGWFIIDGLTGNGEHLNLMTPGKPLTDTKPDLVAKTYANSQWRKYFMSLWFGDNDAYLPYFGQYLCNSYNRGKRGLERLVSFKMYYMLEMTPPPGEPAPPVEKKLMWEQFCGSES
jgi:hypothetical protein